jgi:hypothetical protein
MADTASRASRPAGGACGAPGHRVRHVGRGSYANKLTLAGYRQASIERSGLDKGSFHISGIRDQSLLGTPTGVKRADGNREEHEGKPPWFLFVLLRALRLFVAFARAVGALTPDQRLSWAASEASVWELGERSERLGS